MSKWPDKLNSGEFIADAVKLNARRGQNGLLLLKGSEPLHSWHKAGSNTPEFYAEAHSRVTDALCVLLADPAASWPPVLEVLLNPELDSRYPELDYATAGFAPVTLSINYVLTQCVIRGLLSRPLIDKHRDIAAKAVQALWPRLDPKRAELQEPWQAKQALLMLAFGDHAGVVQQFESDWKLGLAKYETSHRTIIKLAYLLARCALGTGEKDFPLFAKSLATLTQFNYYQWAVNGDLSAKVELPTMALASQLYARICDPDSADARTLLGKLAPATVVTTMHELLP
jgi:hypothetical protein